MENTAARTLASLPGRTNSPAAKARHRQMHRRFATRRLSRLAKVAFGIFGLSVALKPPAAVPARQPLPSALAGTAAATENGAPPRASLRRWHLIYRFSSTFHVKPDLARLIYDVALAEGIDPELAFRLVRVESEFNPRAVSSAGAIGLTQLMPGTALQLDPTATRESLRDPERNLRLGLRHLRSLIREQGGNLTLALLVYNRGPVAVQSDLRLGLNPANGYQELVTRGYRGRGVLD